MDKWLAPAFCNLTTEFSDCRAIVGTKSFDCHKVILASASEFFKGMFLNNFKESASGEIHLPNVTPETFEKFRKYVYTYNERVLNENSTAVLMDLYECANQWLVPSLMSDCLKLLTDRAQSMSVEQLIELYEFAFSFDIKAFIPDIAGVITTKHFKDILCERALLLGSDAFLNYITKVAKRKSSIERYNFIEKYLEINGFIEDIIPRENSEEDSSNKLALIDLKPKGQPDKNTEEKIGTVGTYMWTNSANSLKLKTETKKEGKLKSEYVKSLLSTIDYARMNGWEFYNGPGKSKLLTYQVKYEILFRIMKRSMLKDPSGGALPVNTFVFPPFSGRCVSP